MAPVPDQPSPFGERRNEVGLDGALLALWRGGQGDWHGAHQVVAAREGDRDCDRVHAWLHRVEGDAVNARYWYRRAEAVPATGPVEAEWRELVGAMRRDGTA